MGLVWILWTVPHQRGDTTAEWPVPEDKLALGCPYLRKGTLVCSVPSGGLDHDRSMISPVSIDGFWPSLLHWLILKIDRLWMLEAGRVWHEAKLGIQTPNLLGPFGSEPPKPFGRSRSTSLGIVPVTSWWTRARPSLKQPRRTTPRMKGPPKPLMVASAPPSVKPVSRTGKRSSFLVVVPTALAKASSSITAAFRPRLPPVMLVSSR